MQPVLKRESYRSLLIPECASFDIGSANKREADKNVPRGWFPMQKIQGRAKQADETGP